MIDHANISQMKSKIAIWISDLVDFREEQLLKTKRAISKYTVSISKKTEQSYVIIPRNRASKYVKQRLIELTEGRLVYNYRDLSTVSTTDKTNRQKTSRDIEGFNSYQQIGSNIHL